MDLRKVCVNLGEHRVLEDVSLRVERGEFVGIAGPNGGGKSTLLRAMLGLVPTASGAVRVFGDDVRRRRHPVGYLPQNAADVEAGFPATAQEIVAMGLTGRRRWPWRSVRGGKAAVLAAMQATGVAALARRRIGEMSGGQRQRVLLAKALVASPELLVLDEPTTGVDPTARDSFAHLLADLNHARDLTIIMVSHDADMLHHAASRLVVVDGKIVSDGRPERVASSLRHLHER